MALDQKKLLQFAQEADQKKKQNAQQTLQQGVTGGSGSGTPSYRTPASPSAPTNQGTMSWGDFNRYHNDYSTWSTTGQHAADYGTWSTPQGNDAYQLIANRAKNGAQVALIGDQYYAMDKGKYNQYEQDYNYWTKTHKHMPGFEQWSSDSDLETWRTIRDYNYGVRSGLNPSMELQGFINGLDPQALEATRTAYQKEWTYDITDAEDMARKEQGLPPKNKDKYYGKSELDQWLYSQGLPSTKSNYFAKQYQAQADALAKKRAEWADQPIYDFHSNEQQQAVGKALAEYWKSTWTYSNSAEDKQRQREGKPPKALDKLYTESEIDQYYKALGLPPASEIDSYVEGFDTAKDAYNGLIDEYFQRKNSAPWEDSRTILEGIMQDDKDGAYREIISGMDLDEKDLTGLEGDDLLSAYLGTGKKKTAKSSGPFALSIDKLESMYDEAYSAAYKAEYGRDYAKGDSLYDYVTGSTGDGLDAKTFDFVTGSEDLGYEDLSKRIGMIDLIRQEIEHPMSLADWTAEYGDTLDDADDAVNAYNRYKEEWKRNHPLDDDLQEQRRKLFRERKKYAREKGRELDAASEARRAEQAALLGSLWGASPEFVQKWSAGGKDGSVSNAELNALTGQGSIYKTTSDALQTEYESILSADNDPNSERNKAIEARTSELMQQMLSTWAAQDAQRRIEQFQNDPDWETIRAQVQSMADAGWERFEIEDQFPRDIEQAALDDVYGPEDTGEYVPSEADRKLAESEARKRAELEYPSDAEDAAIGLDAWSWIMNPKAQVYKETANASSEYTELFPYMTDEQIKEFARIAQDEGAVAAGRYWKEIRPDLEKAKAELESEGVQYDAEGRPLVASLESALLSLPAGIEGIGVELAALKGDYRENDWRGSIGRRKSGLQQTVSFNIRENNGALASFLYDTTMSMADSLQSMALGDVGLAITGFRAAADTVNEYIARGADPRTAGIMGGIAWAAEFVTEKMDMDRLFEMKNDGTFAGLLKSVFIGSGLPEAAEEGVSEIVDIIGDTFMMADQSEFLQTMSKFEAEGASTPNAFWKTLYSYAGARIGMAMAGGFVSGVVMGTGFTVAHGGKIAQESGYSWLRFQKGFKILNEYDQALQNGKAFEGSMQRVYSDITASGISPSAQVAAASVFQTAAQTPSEFTSESAMKAVQKLQEMIQKAIERNNIYGAETAEARTKSQNRLMDLMTGIQTAYQNAGAALQSRNLELQTQYLNEMRGLINQYNQQFGEAFAAMRTRSVKHDAEVAQQERDVQAATTTAQAGMQQAGDEMAKKLLTDGAILVDENGQTVQVDDETLAKIRSGEIDVNELIRQSGETANIGVARRWMGYNQQAPEQSAADWARGIMDPNGYWAKKPRNQALKALQREYQNRNEALRSQYDQAVAEGRSSDASRIREDMRVLSQQYEAAQASILSGEAGIGAVSTAEQATGPNVMKGARLETEADKAAGGTQAETTTETQAETQTETAPETAPQNDGAVTESARAAQERAEVEADRAQVETEEQARIREDYESQMAELEQELQDAVDTGDAEQQNLIEETIDALQDEFDRKYKAAAETDAATDTTTGTETETQTDTETEEKTDGKQDTYPTREYEQENGPRDRTSAGNGSSQPGYAGPSGQAQAYQGVDEQTFKRDTGNAARQWTLTTKSGSIPTFERATPSAQTAQIINNMRRPGGPVVSTYARRNNMPAAFNSTGTRDGNIYVGITGDDGYDSINVPFQIGHELSEGDAGLRAVGNAVLKKLPRQQVRNLVDNYMAILNEDTDGDVKFPGYAAAAKEMICDIHGALRAIEQNPNLDIETVFASLGIDPEVGLAVANAMVDALSDEASTQVPGTTGAELAQQYREAYRNGQLEPDLVPGQLDYLNDGFEDGVVNVDGLAELSVRGFGNGVGLNVEEDPNAPGHYIFRDAAGRRIRQVKPSDLRGSPIGLLIDLSKQNNFISEEERARQYKLFAGVANLLIKCEGDMAKAQLFTGAAMFTAMKKNSDKQYGLTWDFVSICTKTQAIIDAMSAKMVQEGRGLTDDEILDAYRTVFEFNQPVPCPECYVFSRWIGIGSLLDNIASYQNRYKNMVEQRGSKLYATEEAITEYNEIQQTVMAKMNELNEKLGKGKKPLTFGKVRSQISSKAQSAYEKADKDLREAIRAAEEDGDEKARKDIPRLQKEFDEARDTYERVKAFVWMDTCFFKDRKTGEVYSKVVDGSVREDFLVPNSVLFDLNKGGEFAEKYSRTWEFRTTQGAGYGKAITPYAEARAGEGIMVIGQEGTYIKAKQNGTAVNFFEMLDPNGQLSPAGRTLFKNAMAKVKQQAWIGGNRWQSTSDSRFENTLDYFMAALDMQAIGAFSQSYTKVSEAVEMFAKMGLFPNQSLMPNGNGLEMNRDGSLKKDKNGEYIPKDTRIGGMRPDEAQANRMKYAGAGTITIGVNDKHIRAMFHQYWRDFIIPYHVSGGNADMIREMRRTQDPDSKGTGIQSSDYTKVQGEKILEDAVLRYVYEYEQGMNPAQVDEKIRQVHRNRQLRLDLLSQGTKSRARTEPGAVKLSDEDRRIVNTYGDILGMTVNDGNLRYVEEGNESENYNPIMRRLYERLHSQEWWDMRPIAKTKMQEQIYPNEYWDQTTTYETSGRVTRDYLNYCDSLGFLHKFAGTNPAKVSKNHPLNGKYEYYLRPVSGRDEHGNVVPHQDLAYVYDEAGNKTDQIEDYFWKVLTDRQMYFAQADENGQHPYQPQRRVTLDQINRGTLEHFAKVDENSGKRYYNQQQSRLAAQEFASHTLEQSQARASGLHGTKLGNNVQRSGGYLMDAVMNPGGQTQSEGQTEFSSRSLNITPEQDAAYMDAVNSGDMETAQRMVDEAAEAAMPDSKARNADGHLMRFYHGSDAEFREFDRGRIGSHGRFEGAGFNFTPSETRAAGYGRNMLSGYIDIRNPLSSERKTMSVRQLAQLISEIDPTGDNIISNYARNSRDYGSPSFISRESMTAARMIWDGSENDVDIYSEISIGDPDTDGLIEAFKRIGYDGLIHYDGNGDIKTVITFDSNQFKRADPVTYHPDGTPVDLSERFNRGENDINYSPRGLSPKMADYRIRQLEGMVKNQKQELADYKQEANARLKKARERYRVEKGREQVTARAKQLYDWLQRPTKKEHVPIPLQGYIAGILENLDIGISERGNADTRAFRNAVSGLKQFYTDYVTGAQNRYDFAGFQTTVPPEIFEALDEIERWMQGMPRLGTMNANQVEALKKVLGQVRKDTMLANSMMRNKRYKTVAAAGEQTQKDADAKGTRKIWKLKSVQDLLTTRMMDAFSWAKAVGKGAESVIDELESGMEKSYARIHEGAEWSEKTLRENGVKKKDIRKWGRDAVQVTFENGKTGRFTTAQIMEVYALSKRSQARAHMLTGGIEIADMKNGHRQTDRYVLTETDLNAIIEKLTPQQRKLIDAMQQYLSTDVAEWGNETWRALYDYEMFGEDNYWPIKSAARGVKTQDPEAANVINALLNMGMTKLTVPNASNPLTINDAFDTWTGHVAQMARLNGLAIPIEDALKWYNWVGSNEDGTRNYDVATKAAVDKVLGPEGSRYFLKLMKDINGLSTGDAGTQFASELMSKYKKAAVAGKLRVVVQQPTAIIRSWTLINPKYFANQTAGQIKKNVAEMQGHSSLAWWKSQGNYDVGTGKSLKSVFFGTDNVLDDITDVAMKPAGWADDFAWSWLWSAVKAETKAEHPELTAGTDAYWEHVNTRFADIVNQTQVVDGILQRSDLMRSKNGLDQMASAFMAEPTKAYNMIRNRLMALVEQAKTDGVKSIFVDRKLGGELIRALIAFVVSIAANSAVLAAHDSFKKRNKGDKFSTAFNENFWTNVRNDVKPWEYIPYIKDVAAIMSGDSVERMDMSMIDDVYRAVQNGYKFVTGSGSKTGYKVVSDLVSVAGAMSGVPATGLIATMETITNGISPGFIKKNAYLDRADRAVLREAGISYDMGYGIAAQYKAHPWADKSASTNAEKAVFLLKAADAVGGSYTDAQFDILSEMIGGMKDTSYDPKKDGSFGKWARKNVDKYVADKKKKGELTEEVKKRYDGYGDILSDLGY